MRVSASFKIIPRRGSVRVRNRGRSVRVRIPSRGGKGLSPRIQYASSPDNRAYCYTEFTVPSVGMAVIIASTPWQYPREGGQAELAWVATGWLNIKRVYPRKVTKLSTNPTQRTVTSMTCATSLS